MRWKAVDLQRIAARLAGSPPGSDGLFDKMSAEVHDAAEESGRAGPGTFDSIYLRQTRRGWEAGIQLTTGDVRSKPHPTSEEAFGDLLGLVKGSPQARTSSQQDEPDCLACGDDDDSCPHCHGDSAESERREMRSERRGEQDR